MSQIRNKRQNNIRAGVFVSLTIVLGLVVFTILTNAWTKLTTTTSTYSVTFPVSDGIGSLASGSKVRLGGVLVGNVSSVAPRLQKDTPITQIDVEFQLDQQYTLYTNASLHSKAGLLGSTGWLSISDVGSGEVATNESMLHGDTETMLSQLLGKDAQLNISKSLEALRKLSQAASNDGGALKILLGEEESRSLDVAIRSARSSLESLDSVLQSTEEIWPAWKQSVTTILTDTQDLPATVKETLHSVQTILADVQANVLPNVENAMQSLDNAMASLESMSVVYEKKAPVWASGISDIIKNTEQISARAEQAIDEISASPWRLLYRPTDREIAYEQLNAASWQLLTALSDLRDSADTLEELSLSDDAPEKASILAASLRESAIEFEKARTEILERMKLDFPNR
tara:strand:+ start:1573 stop:2775 length:1203 start_codon:yes stop_codon:yes gene_type:complete